MRALKIYLGVVFVILLAALLLGVYVWYTLQKLDSSGVPVLEGGSALEEDTALPLRR